jgi:hypothetical protein
MNVPVKLTPMIFCQCARSTSSHAVNGTMLALLTRISISFAFELIWANSAWTDAGSEMSAAIAMALPPIAAAASRPPSALMSLIMTVGPSSFAPWRLMSSIRCVDHVQCCG